MQREATPSRQQPARERAGNGSHGIETPERMAAEEHPTVWGERALWRAVIVQALMDAACGGKKQETAQAREEALVWLRGTGRDFHTVAYHAGFEPDYLREMIGKVLARGCQWRALPGEGARIRRTRPRPAMTQARHRR